MKESVAPEPRLRLTRTRLRPPDGLPIQGRHSNYLQLHFELGASITGVILAGLFSVLACQVPQLAGLILDYSR